VSYAVHSTHFKPLGLMDFTYNLKFWKTQAKGTRDMIYQGWCLLSFGNHCLQGWDTMQFCRY